MVSLRVLRLWFSLVLLAPALLFGQGLPSGSLDGSVTSAGDGLPLPGVIVTARSPALQGARQTVTSVNGGFFFPNLPPGEYSVELKLQGFQTVTRTGIPVGTSQRQDLHVAMSVEAVSASVTVTAESEQVSMTSQSTTTLTAAVITQLPLPRTLESVALLAPDVAGRPANPSIGGATDYFSIAGGETYENAINIDGVSVQENLFRSPEPIYIEDAISEVATLTSGISAEYGRFAGGVVNVLTKTGGNSWSASFRTTLLDDAWSATTPYGETRSNVVSPVYEVTLGAPIWKDRVWFFGAGRLFDLTTTQTTAPPTQIGYPSESRDKRYQLKLTASPLPGQTLTVGYTHRASDVTDTYYNPWPILDLASLYDQSYKEDHLLVNYSGVLSTNVSLEADYGRLRLTSVYGSTDTSLLTGTPILNQVPFVQYNAPLFCSVCPPPQDSRNTDQGVLKGTLFAPTTSLGSHTVVGGGEFYKGAFAGNNWQSGSGYAVSGTDVIYSNGDLYPVFGPGTVLAFLPIPVLAQHTDIRTYSAYVNDTWRLSDRLTFSLGVRWDKKDAKDPAGTSLSTEGTFSPRLAVAWDPTGKGTLRLTGSVGRYVSTISENQIFWVLPYGNAAQLYYFYDGPEINTDPSQPLVSRADALRQLFQWFGVTSSYQPPNAGIDPFSAMIPGLTTQLAGDLKSQRADEFSLGVNGSIGAVGSFRVEGVYRKYGNFYNVELDTTTGTVTDPYGNTYDLGILRNANEPLERKHVSLKAALQLQPARTVAVGGSWTWAHTYGNQISESMASGPYPPGDLTYPEYWQASWHIPVGDLPQDIRHRIRLWATWDMDFVPAWLGSFGLSGLFSLNTGQPYGASGPAWVSDYVANPGYALPPSYLTYWFTNRDAYRTPTVTRFDLALNYSLRLGPVELFVQPQVVNLFNNQKIATNEPSMIDQGVLTAVNSPELQPFDPFHTQPVKGVHYELSPTFGQALSAAAYQQPRTFKISMGVRF